MSILSTNHRLISIGESYSAGSGIDITDQVISVTGDVVPYSAGDNIDIQGHVISGKDWTQEITDASSDAFNETTAWVHDNYANSADVSYLSGVVDNKLDTSAWSSVSSNFATEDYVIMADNITYDRTTGYVENQQFAKESACQFAFEQLNTNKLDASSFTDWQNGQYSTDLQTIEGQIANKLDTSSFSEVSGDFQPRGDYVERDTVYSAIESATSSKLDVSSFASVSSDFLTTAFGISESATWNDVSETVQTNSASWADGGTGDEEVNSFVYNNSATINEVNTAYQQYSATYQPSGNYIPYTAYNTINGYYTDKPLTVKGNLLDRTTTVTDSLIILQSNDTLGRPLTHTTLSNYELNFSGRTGGSAQVDLSSINKWNEVSTTVQSNSAQWAEGGGSGDEEVNSLVHTNSATWNTVTNKLDTTAQVVTGYTTATIEGTNAINSLNGKPIISWRTQSAQEAGIANNARYDYEGNNLVDDHNSLTSLKDVVQSNSAQWAEVGNVPVSNSGDLYKVEFDGVDLYGYKKTTTIPHYVYTAMKSSTGNSVEAYDFPSFENVGFSSNVAGFYNADIITFSSNGEGIYPSEDSRYGTTALNVYYKASNLYDWNNNQYADFSGYIGQITLDNLVISSYLKKPSYFNKIFRCGNFDLWFSSNYGRDGFPSEYVLSLVDESLTGTSTIEGIFVPSSTDLSNYYTKSETSGASEIADALANIPTGNPEVENYVQTNSGTIDETTNVVQSNSAQWSQSGTTYTSPSGTILIEGDNLEGTNSAISYSDGFISALTFEHVVAIPENNDVKYYEFNLPAVKTVDLAYRYWSDYEQQYTTGTVRAENYSQVDTIVRYPSLSADYYGDTSMSGYLVRITATPPNNTTAISAFGKIPSVVELALKSDLPTYEYDNTNKISAINGSAIAAGDEFPASANEAITAYQNASATYLTAHQAISADEWNNCYNNVNTNSGAWGGSALPISAGPGVKLQLVDNTLVVQSVLSAGKGINVTTSNNSLAVSTVPSSFYTLNISNIILTASLPGSPDANTLYLIQE